MTIGTPSDFARKYILVNPPRGRELSDNVKMSKPPRVSFCIPTKNNESTILTCLKSIADQDYPDIEIIIIDGYSTDKTVEIAKEYSDKIIFDKGTYGGSVQTGIEESTGQILGLFDSDTEIPSKKWLINAVPYFNLGEKVSTVWPLQTSPEKSPMSTRFYLRHWNMILSDRILKNRGLFGGGNGLFLREAIDEIGGIDRRIHWGADFDWARKLRDRGYQVVMIGDPIYHHTMTSFRQFAKKQFVGADTFMETGFGMMELSNWDIFMEQFVIGSRGMLRGLFLERDSSWLLFLPCLSTKAIAYAFTFVRKRVK